MTDTEHPDLSAALTALGLSLSSSETIAVACSGGPDSMALALLAKALQVKGGPKVKALIVDHGLRPESGDEAQSTADVLRSYNIPATILVWQGDKPSRNVQATARAARYRLLREECLKVGIQLLLTAHHQEDQAETFLLRLARGSGVDGLSAMAPVTDLGGVKLVRPLLETSKADLVALAEDAGASYILDPSNQMDSFARVRMRKLLPVLEGEGLSPKRLAATAARMRRAREALEIESDQYLACHANWSVAGFIRFDRAAFQDDGPIEIALRVLSDALMRAAGEALPPRMARVEALLGAIRSGTLGGGRTCAGCRVIPEKTSEIIICREYRAVESIRQPVSRESQMPIIWDGRYALSFANADALETGMLEIGALGSEGWRQVKEYYAGIETPLPDAPPAAIRATLPAIWCGERLITAPHFGVQGEISCSARFIGGDLGFSWRGNDTI